MSQLHIPAAPADPPGRLLESAVSSAAAALGRSASGERRFRALLLGGGFLALFAIGGLNLTLLRRLDLDYFYLLACALLGWTAGVPVAWCGTLVSALFIFLADVRSGYPFSAGVLAWNTLARVLGFAAITWLAAQAGRLMRQLEQKVEQRTASLRSEAEEHKETAELLHESLQLFKQVTENITDVFWVTDVDKSQVHYVSPEFENIWGENRQSLYLSPSTWLDHIHPEDRQRVSQATYTKQVSGDYDEEFRVVRPDGSLRWVHDRAFPVKREDGTVYRLVGIVEDITERKQTEQLLRAQRDVGVALSSTSDMRFALERLLDIALQLQGIDCGGVYLMDPRAGSFDLEAHRGLSGSFARRISHFQPEATEARLVRSRESYYARAEQIPRDLEVLWGSEGLRSLAVLPVQHKGEVIGMLNLGSYRLDEIPQKTRVGIEMIASQAAGAIARIRAEESLRASEANLRTLVHTSPIALVAGDRDGRITFADGQALKAVDLEPLQIIGQSFRTTGDRFPGLVENIRRTLAGEEFSAVLEAGPVVLECHHRPTPGQDGEIDGFLVVATDVTERFRLERQILEISDREQARIGQDIHDGLCQQLVGAAFDANSLQQSLAGQQRPEAATAERISTVLDEAITESRRVSRGLYPVRLETEGLVPALHELARMTSERFQVHCVCDAPLPGPACDSVVATHLYRIAQEAVNNALKHSRALVLRIHLAEEENRVELTVRDDGVGFDPAARSAAGMGLHTMEYRARTLGGRLRVSRGALGGTVVLCDIPRKSRSHS
ncbi:MAG: PAS domain S-box protein [Verrucomicrobiota bacterium]